jgi:hypothetical protein
VTANRLASDPATTKLAIRLRPSGIRRTNSPKCKQIGFCSRSIRPVCMGERRIIKRLSPQPPSIQTFVHYAAKSLIMITEGPTPKQMREPPDQKLPFNGNRSATKHFGHTVSVWAELPDRGDGAAPSAEGAQIPQISKFPKYYCLIAGCGGSSALPSSCYSPLR